MKQKYFLSPNKVFRAISEVGTGEPKFRITNRESGHLVGFLCHRILPTAYKQWVFYPENIAFTSMELMDLSIMISNVRAEYGQD